MKEVLSFATFSNPNTDHNYSILQPFLAFEGSLWFTGLKIEIFRNMYVRTETFYVITSVSISMLANLVSVTCYRGVGIMLQLLFLETLQHNSNSAA